MIINHPDGMLKVVHSDSIAKSLLEIGAVKLDLKDLFTWTSGIHSPIYCDNRIINSKPGVRDEVVSEFSDAIALNFGTRPDIIAGVATGGMTYGAIVATRLNLPFIYVRSERKEYGMKKVVEGYYNPGDKVVLIEDHISTGKSSIRAVDYLREEGLEVLCLFSIMTYGSKVAEDSFKEKHIPVASLCDLDTILRVALNEKRITRSEADTILEFRNSPGTWEPNK